MLHMDVDAYAPGTADPGGRGISSTRIVDTPSNWSDYVHSPANGDAALDMYGSVPNGAVGDIMTDVYDTATALQFNDMGALTRAMVRDLTKIVYDSGLLGSVKGGIDGLFGFGFEFILGMVEDVHMTTVTLRIDGIDYRGDMSRIKRYRERNERS